MYSFTTDGPVAELVRKAYISVNVSFVPECARAEKNFLKFSGTHIVSPKSSWHNSHLIFSFSQNLNNYVNTYVAIQN